MAVMQDPTGAFVSVWQPKLHIGYTLIGEPGAVGWNELRTRDPEAAKAFYSAVFGWTPEDSSVGGGYVEFKNNGQMVAGMMKLRFSRTNSRKSGAFSMASQFTSEPGLAWDSLARPLETEPPPGAATSDMVDTSIIACISANSTKL